LIIRDSYHPLGIPLSRENEGDIPVRIFLEIFLGKWVVGDWCGRITGFEFRREDC
jgi:hypothetical protein